MASVDGVQVVLFFEAMLGAVLAYVSFNLYHTVRDHSNAFVNKVVKPKKSFLRDLDILFLSNVSILLGFVLLFFGLYVQSQTIVVAGELFMILFFIATIVVLRRWGQRVWT